MYTHGCTGYSYVLCKMYYGCLFIHSAITLADVMIITLMYVAILGIDSSM